LLKPYLDKTLLEVGCDEAGRGCLAGPVFAGAVILPKDFYHPLLQDSKKINEKTRDFLRDLIKEEAIAWAVASITPKQIDKINILNASILAMQKAVGKLGIVPEKILVDGNRFKPYKEIPYECIIKGDGKVAAIAAASVLAKTARDEYMKKIHKKFPQYDWLTNKGYPTKAHREAVIEHGSSPHHRKTFRVSIQEKGKQKKLFI